MRPTDALSHPADWHTTTVRSSVELRRGVSWSKDQEHSAHGPNRFPVIGIRNIQDRLELDKLIFLSGLKPHEVEKARVSAGWIVMVGSNGNRSRIGNAQLINYDADLLFASFLISAKPRPDSKLRSDYFFRWLSTEQVQSYLSASAEGTTELKNLSLSFFNQMVIPVPPLEEQTAIVGILDAVDTALQRTREAADHARKLVRALLQSSFEFSGSQGPWKDTHAGRIPLNWDMINGRQAFTIVASGCTNVDALRLPQYDEPPDAWFMKVDDFNDPANRRAILHTKVGFRKQENGAFRVLPVGTVVIAKRGAAIMKNRVRTTAVPIALDPNLMALQAQAGIHPEFLRLQLEWRNLSRYVEDSGVPQLNNKDLYPRYFYRAPHSRQLEIINIVGSAEQAEDATVAKCAAIEQLKASLFHDLLTGKVRVRKRTE